MCRLLGFSIGKEQEDLNATAIAVRLFPALVGQGPHAYGWMSYNEEKGGIEYVKQEGRCDTLEAFDVLVDNVDPDAKWLVGHTRWATHGSPSDNRNNHPIPHGDIIGVHNGVLRNHKEILSVTGREDEATEVDSEAIFAAVNRWGPSPGLRKIKGDMVAIYANRTRPHVLHLARSHGRQLTLAWSEKGNLFFASDRHALEKLAPEIKFVAWSAISENRLLLVRDGKIIQRYRYAPLPRAFEFKAPSRPVVTSDQLGPAELSAIERLRRAENVLTQQRASKRGEIFAERQRAQKAAARVPAVIPAPLSKKQKKRAKRAAAARASQDRRLVLVNGQWIDSDVWEAAKRSEAAEAAKDEAAFDPGVCYGD